MEIEKEYANLFYCAKGGFLVYFCWRSDGGYQEIHYEMDRNRFIIEDKASPASFLGPFTPRDDERNHIYDFPHLTKDRTDFFIIDRHF